MNSLSSEESDIERIPDLQEFLSEPQISRIQVETLRAPKSLGLRKFEVRKSLILLESEVWREPGVVWCLKSQGSREFHFSRVSEGLNSRVKESELRRVRACQNLSFEKIEVLKF